MLLGSKVCLLWISYNKRAYQWRRLVGSWRDYLIFSCERIRYELSVPLSGMKLTPLLKFHSTGQAIETKKQQKNLVINIIVVAIAFDDYKLLPLQAIS